MKTLLWLDDVRDPYNKKVDWLVFSPIGRDIDIFWVKNYEEFVLYIMVNGLPDAICFDHDIADEEMTGYDCAKWLVEYHQKHGGKFPKYAIQSANPVGKENIDCYLKNYLKFNL